jgi:hypothetical protein
MTASIDIQAAQRADDQEPPNARIARAQAAGNAAHEAAGSNEEAYDAYRAAFDEVMR